MADGAVELRQPVERDRLGATDAHERLDIFVGTWHTVGEILSGDEGPPRVLRAIDTYEWGAGGHFLVHHVDGDMGGHPVQALEVIGWDPDRGDYFSHAYDNTGSVASYRASLTELRWQILGAQERFDGQFSEDRHILRGQWERLVDGCWTAWMTISLTRV